MLRLWPGPQAAVTLDQVVAELRPWQDPPVDRPRVLSNFVLSLDGRATLDGRSGEIGGSADLAMLVRLRTRVDAVMIGAGTMRAERYGRVIADPAKRERRERLGLPHDPLLVLISGSLDLPWDAGLFTSPGRVLIFTHSSDPLPETTASVRAIRSSDPIEVSQVLRHLRTERGIRSVLCEGGPHLHAQLQLAGLVDELFLTTAPKLIGGEGPGLVPGLLERGRQLSRDWLLLDEQSGDLFGRYLFGDPAPVAGSGGGA